jgi:thymidylate synthase
MINIKGKNINELVYKVFDKLIIEGNRTSSRNGDVSSLYNVFTEIENPRSRHLGLVGRNNNIFATIAETFWVFAGEGNIDPFLSFYLPRAKDYSDDGISWYGNYGERLYKYDQMDDIIQQFRNEGIFTRRASFYIGTPELDTKQSFQKQLGSEFNTVKDRPCNLGGDFFITPDKKLHMNMKSRSGDSCWGFGSINIFEWTFFQEFIAQQLQYEIDQEITLGTYNHHVTNLHLYDFNGKQAYDVIENKLKQRLGTQNYDKLIFPNGVYNFQSFNYEIVQTITRAILSKETDYDTVKDEITDCFDRRKIPTQNNLLYTYATMISLYACIKSMELPKGEKANIEFDISHHSDEFKQSVEQSIFRKFNLKV